MMGWRVHSFVLMANHYHLLIETTRPTLVRGMQYLNSTCTHRWNVRHKARGRLFGGRHKALLVDGGDSGYFLTVSDYIHLNPVRARKARRVSRREFREYLERRMVEAGGKGDPRWGKIRWGWCLGSEGFVARMKERLEEPARKPRREESWAGEAVEEREEELAERVLWTGLRERGHRRLAGLRHSPRGDADIQGVG